MIKLYLLLYHICIKYFIYLNICSPILTARVEKFVGKILLNQNFFFQLLFTVLDIIPLSMQIEYFKEKKKKVIFTVKKI